MRKSRLLTNLGLFSSLLLLPVAHGSPVTYSSPAVDCEHTQDNNNDDTETQVQEEDNCMLVMHGKIHKSLKLTETPDQQDLTVVGSSSCQLTILAVGPGGEGYYSGGGSGYLNYKTVAVQNGGGAIIFHVGYGVPGDLTTVNIPFWDGNFTLIAERGKDSHYNSKDGFYYGGDGYSGGGSQNCPTCNFTCNTCYGGSNGGNGGGDWAGHGTRENITDYMFSSWKLTPGAGGKKRQGKYDGVILLEVNQS